MSGIDYGMGQTNVDHSTGIRYGVIPAGDVCQAWSDSSEGDYGEASCPKCGNTAEEYDEDKHGEYTCRQGQCCDYACTDCEEVYDSGDCYGEEALGWTLDADGYKATQSGDDSDVFILLSPYYTRAQYCSPCAPGACHLRHPEDDGDRAYCFGHDWFDDGCAPYPVYEVATGKLVPAPVKGGGK